jgi:hypothetical protein
MISENLNLTVQDRKYEKILNGDANPNTLYFSIGIFLAESQKVI